MVKEHQPVILGRIGKVSKQYTNPLVPRGVDNGPAGTTMGVGSTWNTNFERPKPPPTIGELEDVARQRFASSATDTQDGLRRERQRITAGNFTSEEDAQAARHFNDTRRGGTADADPWYYVPPLPITGRDRDRISASDQQRDRHRSCANIDPPSSIPALPSSAPYNPGYTAPIHGPPVSAVITAMKSVSFDDSGEQSGSSHKGRNGLSRPQVSYTRPGVLPPSIIRPTAAKKSVSLDSGVQPSMSLNDWNGPSDIQDSYARHGHGVPLPSSSRPVVAKKSVSFDSAGFQPSSSRAGPPRLPYEAHYEFSYPLETPKESWQSSNRLRSQHSLLDVASGSSNYPVWPTNTHHGVSEGEYNQTLNQFLNEAQQKELEMRRNKEEETKRKEDEIKWKDGQAQRWEGFTRHAENSTRRFGGEERRPAQDPTLRLTKRNEDEVRRQDKEARFQGEVARATEEVIRRTEEESTRWEGLHSLEDLTNEVRGRSSYPIASGGFGDIWKCVLVKSSEAVQVAVKTIRAFESDNEEVVRKNAKRVRRELKVWGRLKHDCILPLWGVANDFGPYPAMVCPWADNGALTSFLEREEDRLSPQDRFSLLNDIALGLQYLHRKSVVHGDLTGSNVLINGQGRACLADFGLSTIIVEFIGTTYFTNSIWGNIRWAATELYEAPDNASLTTECDIYSFGSIILQILTCKVPYYYMKKDIAVLAQVIKGMKPQPPKESRIAPGHWRFIQQCWLPRARRPSTGDIVAFVGHERRALSS